MGGARRRYGLKGNFLSIHEMCTRRSRWSGGRSRSIRELADAHMWLGAACSALGHRRGDRGNPGGAPARARQRPGAPGPRARLLGRQGGLSPAAIPEFERAIELNPEAGYSYLQLALLLAWDGQLERAEEICRRAVELQEQYISGNVGLQIVGAHARLGYVHYLQGSYDEALREYERELAFIGVERSRAARPDA